MHVFLGAVHLLAFGGLVVSLPGRWNLFILDNVWNATAVGSMRCATKSARFFCPSPCALMIMRATLSVMTSLASIMNTASLLSSKWLPAS